jgi:hypothetical protein
MFALVVILMLAAFAAVLASLAAGLVVMARGRPGDSALSNRLMRWRVTAQGLALLLFVLAMLMRVSG